MIHKVLCLILIGLVVFPSLVFAEETPSLVISQVQVSGPAGASDEFIELHNSTAQAVNLSGWSLQYKTASGSFPISSKRNLPDFSLDPGKYYLIAHTDFFGIVTPDLRQSAFSLSGAAAGATIFLSKSDSGITGVDDPNIVDKLAYGTGEGNSPENAAAALPESGKVLFRIANLANNSADFEVRDPEPRNSTYTAPAQEEDNDEESSEEENEDQESEEEQEEDLPPAHSIGIVISEIMANPEASDSGEEWVELFNSSTEPINLKDWLLDDSSVNGTVGTSSYKISEFVIQPNAYASIAVPEGKFSLNNSSADSVRLFWSDKVLSSEVAYTGPVKEEQTWCRIGTIYKWCTPTPNASNTELPVVPATSGINTASNNNNTTNSNATNTTNSAQQQAQAKDYSSDDIQLIEIMPDPDGADAGYEYVKLYNAGSSAVELKGWVIDDGAESDAIGSSALVLSEGLLDPADELEVLIPKGRFSMNNSGPDTVRVFSPDKKLKDHVAYDKAEEGVAYVLVDDSWAWQNSGSVDGIGQVAGADLPRTGMPLNALAFATIPAFWYIGGAFRNKKGLHEQTRSYRHAGRKTGQQPY
jgi:hypothetical protein